MHALQQHHLQRPPVARTGRPRMSAPCTVANQNVLGPCAPLRHKCQSRPARGSLQIVAGERQTGNTATKRRTSGPPGLPPINGDDGGGGGGGGGWGWERTARNVLPNLVFLGMYFFITSYGGDGWGGGPGGGGGGGGGGDGGGGFGESANPGQEGGMKENDQKEDGERDERHKNASDDEDAAPVYTYRGNRSHYR